jgi:hypothetical protein
MLPPDVAASVSGRTHVAVTRVLPRDGPLLEPRLVSEFGDREDLIAALMTSCHVGLLGRGALGGSLRAACWVTYKKSAAPPLTGP